MPSRFADMFVDLDDDPRADPPGQGDERTTLLAFLRWMRGTLELKCAGLDAADLARRSLEPSKLSLLGLVRHLTDVERGWFRRGLAGEDVPGLYATRDEPDGDFDGAVPDPDVVARAWEAWRTEAAYTDRFAATADLGVTVDDPWRGPLSLRWVLVHIIEEYARHLGHADVLRERIDGRVGQ
jgi:uncharacterized damage-inducible protein DinB